MGLLGAGCGKTQVALLERAPTYCERVFGDDHPDTLTTRNNLAAAYQSAGRFAEAIALYERTFTDSERGLGADHPHSAMYRELLISARNRLRRRS
ncbi:tetratricopeptide repeat protein [Nocardia alba]|uniref:Tetratricopeptide repeat protein n=1 Tax=Nocardia alba TaxID=225051 RepID=A0A4R1F9H0_9NOCA|nr:tetratricopeptide repeat protein [Nocardia alba]